MQMETSGQRQGDERYYCITWARKDSGSSILCQNTGDSLAAAIAAPKEHFMLTVNVVVEHHTFRKRVQRPQESIVQYIASLRELAATCE